MIKLNYIAVAALVLVPNLAQADAERLEKDLRALAGKDSEIHIGEISDSLLGGSTTAKDISIASKNGSTLTILSYKVDGDYENPDEVIARGIRISDEEAVVAADSITLHEPGKAVLDFSNLAATYTAKNPLPGLSIKALVVDQKATEASEPLEKPESEPEPEDPLAYLYEDMYDDEASEVRGAHLEIADITASNISNDGVGQFTLSGLNGSAEQFDELSAVTFSLPSLNLSGLSGLQKTENEILKFDGLSLSALDISADQLVMTLAGLEIDSDLSDGEYHSSLDTLVVDLARMIEQAPADERSVLQGFSDVLTGGSGQLTLNMVLDGTWQQQGSKTDLTQHFALNIIDAFKLELDSDVPIAIPEGGQVSDYITSTFGWVELDSLGGKVMLSLEELGAFGRIVPTLAEIKQVSEQELIKELRTQGAGLGILAGPELGEVLSGLVKLVVGEADRLKVDMTLPPRAEIETILAQDPLGLPAAMQMKVTVE